MRVAIRGGSIVQGDAVSRTDLLIEDDRIAHVGNLDGVSSDVTLDASDCYVMPGGIDVHTHMEYPVAGFTAWTQDDFEAGTLAAAAGGTTTIVDFVKVAPDATLRDTFDKRRRRIEECARIDVGLHVIIPGGQTHGDLEGDLAYVVSEGVTSWKFFMAYPGLMLDDSQMLRGFELARDHGVMVMVHAENGHMVAHDTAALLAEGHAAEANHALAHSDASETEAVNRAITLAEHVGVPLYVVHVSSANAAELIARRRSMGAKVFAETCPQYLTVSWEDYAAQGALAAAYLCSPPIRERSNQERLWGALESGGLDVVATDHAGFCLGGPDEPGTKMGSPGYFPGVPNGVPGVYERLMVMWQSAVVERGMDVRRFVQACSTRPAQLFGIDHRKGALLPGLDADVLVWDPNVTRTLRAGDTPLASDYSIYDGMKVTGQPRHVVAGGRTLVVDGVLQDVGPGGRYVKRASPRAPGM